MQERRSALGKYVLDSLSVGMYAHPLMSLREYIQNCADSIDELPGSSDEASIHVVIDGRRRSLSISDDGQRMLTASSQGPALLWDISTSQVLHTFDATDLRAAGLSGDGRRVLVGDALYRRGLVDGAAVWSRRP